MSNPPPFRNPMNAPDKSVFLFPLSILPKKKTHKRKLKKKRDRRGVGWKSTACYHFYLIS